MKKLIAYFICLLVPVAQFGQSMQTADKVIGVVDQYIILQSDFYSKLEDYKQQGIIIDDTVRGSVLEDLLFSKLLLAQADKDSVYVKAEIVDAELNRRMEMMMQKFPSEEKFAEVYGKSTATMKEEFRSEISDQLRIQEMYALHFANIKVSPQEVREYYQALPKNKLPLIEAEMELGQLVVLPKAAAKEKQAALERIKELRQRVVSGENMTMLSTLYSEDPGSAKNGGIYRNVAINQFAPEFAKAVTQLKTDELSGVVQTTFGYHIIKLLDRKGAYADVQHILISPKTGEQDLQVAKQRADSIYTAITTKKTGFCAAALKFSDDKGTKNNCGILLNEAEGSTRFEVKELAAIDPGLVFLVDKLDVGGITQPTLYQTSEGKQAYRIIYLKNRTAPHVANLKGDYQRLRGMAVINKQQKKIGAWVAQKSKTSYIKVDPEFRKYKLEYNWNLSQDIK